ncbi:hypothetical protein J2751_000990 [Halorubrum alkaliphilum]|uniref:Uncharacterized protein n=1 Tax=Halorubrum alkaliphilum TaxID=261290 RepID=A0A8T4GG01_9EURY|nr:hypothetical protein [Halorubrum alkaliphilum]MBP1921985.1 hypothetical protein [Halorubrum alkaliphilum]
MSHEGSHAVASTAGTSSEGPKVPLAAGGRAAGDNASDEERSKARESSRLEVWRCSPPIRQQPLINEQLEK